LNATAETVVVGAGGTASHSIALRHAQSILSLKLGPVFLGPVDIGLQIVLEPVPSIVTEIKVEPAIDNVPGIVTLARMPRENGRRLRDLPPSSGPV